MSGREDPARLGPAVLALPAEFNVANAWRVDEELDSVFVPGTATVIVDLTATTSCDSSGVAVLALAHGKATTNNAELRLVAPLPAVRHVLVLAGLDRVLRIFPSLDEALAAAPLAAAPVREQFAGDDVPDDVSVLFGRHHEQSGHRRARYAIERLAEMEQIYDRWVTEYSESSGCSPVLLVPDPARTGPGAFKLFATGSALLRFAGGLNGFSSSWPEARGPEGASGAHADLISAFFGTLQDWIAAAGDQTSIQAAPDVSQALDEHIEELAKAGFVVVARERFLLLAGGIDAEPLPWRIVDIKVRPAVLVEIAAPAGNGFSPAGISDDACGT